jgi:putative membrane protein
MPMRSEQSDTRPPSVRNRRVHMANERTFLAWIRTSIGLMAFGFVVERFALFVRQLAHFLGTAAAGMQPSQSHGYASIFGIVLVGLGAVLGVFSYARFRSVEKQIDTDAYRSSHGLDLALTAGVLAIGVFLVVYLIRSL